MPEGIRVSGVRKGSPARHAGLRPGDRIVAVNDEPVRDELDVRFLAACEESCFAVVRHSAPLSLTVHRPRGRELGLTFAAAGLGRCRNRCVFCFIDQMPKGLRRSLYVKDEDILHSFLNGNYLTLTGVGRADLARIADRGLSPIFVSVHATPAVARKRLLGVRRAPDIMPQLRFLASRGVSLHTQIVVCPGYNDGAILTRTIADLLSLGENLLSIAVVPVGLTRHRRFPLQPVDDIHARAICAMVERLGDRDLRVLGRRRVFVADELLIRAGRPVPPAVDYAGYPQLGNGVGLLRLAGDEWRRLARGLPRRRPAEARRVAVIVTSQLALPLLEKIARELQERVGAWILRVVAVENRFFGTTVTVAGLLSARDVIREVRGQVTRGALVIVPGVMFNSRGWTIDGYSLRRLRRAIGARTAAAGDIASLVSLLAKTGRTHDRQD